MKISKTAIALGLTLLLSASFLSGCNSEEQPKSSQNPQQTSSAAADANASTPSTNNSTEGAAGVTSSPSAPSIVISAPNEWTKVESTYVDAQYSKGTASFIVKTEIFKSTTLEDIAKEDTGYLAQAFDKAKFLEPEKVKVGGMDAIKITFTNGEGNTSMKFETILVISGGLTYTITCADLESSFDSAGFDKIISSIDFK